MFTETEWAYWAGFLDADGCICLTGTKGKIPVIAIVLTQGNPHILELGYGKLKIGHIYKVSPSRSNRGGGITFDWRISQPKDARFFLCGIEPYLQIKKDQAQIAIELCNLKMTWAKGGEHQYPMPQEIKNAQWELVYKMRELKKKEHELKTEKQQHWHR